MRILLITDNHAPLGGAEKYFFDLKARLQRLPDMEVFSCGFGETIQKDSHSLVLKRMTSEAGKLLGRFCIHPRTYAKLKAYIQDIKPDIIHLHNVKHHTTSVLKAIRAYPVIQTVHDFSLICPTAQNLHAAKIPCKTGLRSACFWQHKNKKYGLFKYFLLTLAFLNLKRQIKKSVNQFISPSPILNTYLKENNFYPTTTILPFVDINTTPTGLAPNQSHFLFAGGFNEHKGIYLLLEEFYLALRKNTNIKLTIAGRGPEKYLVEKKINDLHLNDQITLIDWQNDLSPYYQKNAAILFPSTGMESFGLVITEAMNHARPVIAVNYGTAAWLIDHHHTGLLFDPLKKGDLAEKIIELSENPALAETLGKNAREKLESMIDNEKTLTALVNTYQTVIDQCR